jgi:hypothetical protein
MARAIARSPSVNPRQAGDVIAGLRSNVYNPNMMTAEEYLKKMQDPLWYGEQDENGVDLSLIRANLLLTPEERLLKGDQATRDALWIRANVRPVIQNQT